jgi:adenylate cyclase
MNAPSLDGIRHCLEGTIPAFLATCDAEGMPNASEISQVHYVDESHVALSYQFFNKTRRNVLATRKASVIVNDSETNALYRLALDYVETRTDGPLFETMRVRLAGIASHSGMQGVFRLLGSDIYRVSSIVALDAPLLPAPRTVNPLSGACRVAEAMAGAADLDALFSRLLEGLERHLEIRHAMVLMTDVQAGALFAIASRGYPSSGIGAEIALGDGVIGVAAASGVAGRRGRRAGSATWPANTAMAPRCGRPLGGSASTAPR